MRVLAFLLLSSVSAFAAGTECPSLFVAGSAPDVSAKMAGHSYEQLCFRDFSVGHSGISAGPLWSAERLTADGVRAAKAVPRVDAFYAEPRLPAADRAELSNYRGSGYDRGHMAPSADMTTEEGQAESFSLANMVPQRPALNRRLWADIESTARGLALSYGEVYVVSGPAFAGGTLSRIGGRVLVPTSTFKAVYVPSKGAAAAWWALNDEAGKTFEVISLDELKRRTGVDVFPTLLSQIKARAAGLPQPRAGADASASSGSSRSPQRETEAPAQAGRAHEPSWGRLVGGVLHGIAREMLK